ncbi:MAG TPA: hypothetical protein EYG02_04340 [Henriciella marina]|uniref:DUF6544 family protein n=1 Tax=Henriciella sp. TaxID=1968823 RepID=UPI0017B1932C|nr:DUF6544 family protein [Henriciella sp.]HIG21928.1 hypothetical protein [Henriciella sp.]HIK64241.1 hypothetical protein [Henriciella marina]
MDLPGPVRELANRLGASEAVGTDHVSFSQSGRMRQDETSRWMPFQAVQTISLSECAFDWRARTGPFGLVHVRDCLRDGEGQIGVSVLRLVPMARVSSSSDATRGELLRYLAELPWAPSAVLQNPHLEWEASGDAIIVRAKLGEVAGEIRFSLDDEGYIAEAYAADRPRAVRGGFETAPWRGQFRDYRKVSGVVIPHAAEVAWLDDGGEVTVWEGRLETWEGC